MENLIPAWVDGTLAPKEKILVHRQGLRHKAVSVFVLSQAGLLIQRRALGKYHTPGLWANTCCTHPNWAEAPADCASRRLFEELGIEGLQQEFRGRVEYRADVGNGMIEDEVVDVFAADAMPDLKISPNADEVMDFRWIPVDDLQAEIERTPQIFTPWLRIYLSEHRQQILGA